MDRFHAFVGKLLDPMRAQTQLVEGAKVGEAEVVMAVYDVPDTGIPHGLKNRQIIDRGALDDVAKLRTEDNPLPFFLDHGFAHVFGAADSRLKIGKSKGFRSADEGFIGHLLWNLDKQVGRDAFSDAVFDPFGTRFSWRWNQDETYRAGNGDEHVRHIPDLLEVSQLTIDGAQQGTYVIPESIKVRSVTAHHTGAEDEEWDPTKQVAGLSAQTDPLLLRRMFAQVDPDGDPAVLDSYRFPHHMVIDGKVGVANVRACQAVIDELNQHRGYEGSDWDRAGVYEHAATHLREAGVEPERLRSRMPELEDLRAMVAADEDFKAQLVELVGPMRTSNPEPKDAGAMQLHLGYVPPDGHAVGANALPDDFDELTSKHRSLHELFQGDHFHDDFWTDAEQLIRELVTTRSAAVVTAMRSDRELLEKAKGLLARAEEPSPLTKWYEVLWRSRIATPTTS
jgi:hypothetical protein